MMTNAVAYHINITGVRGAVRLPEKVMELMKCEYFQTFSSVEVFDYPYTM
jgi:hypothetical protein